MAAGRAHHADEIAGDRTIIARFRGRLHVLHVAAEAREILRELRVGSVVGSLLLSSEL